MANWTTYKIKLRLQWSKWGEHWGWQSLATWRMKLKPRTASRAQRRIKKRRTCHEQQILKLISLKGNRVWVCPDCEEQQDCGEKSFLVWLTYHFWFNLLTKHLPWASSDLKMAFVSSISFKGGSIPYEVSGTRYTLLSVIFIHSTGVPQIIHEEDPSL